MAQISTENFLNSIKAYIFPTLVTIIGILIWRDISEMRADVKMLLAQSNIDKTKIENLEKDVRQLENSVFNKKAMSDKTYVPLFMSLYYKHEEIYDVKKHIKKQQII